MEGLLERIRGFAKELPEALNVEAKAVIVFGSAARPSDFVPGLSDVDVAVIVEGEPIQRSYTIERLGHRFEISIWTLEEVLKLYEEGDPLAHMLSRGVFVYDDGVSKLLPPCAKVTVRTAAVLRRSAIVALGLALENYFVGDLRKAVSHLYHSLRHLIRYLRAVEGAPLPISNEEVLAASPMELRGLVKDLIARRGEETLSPSEVRSAIEKAIQAVCRFLSLKPPALSKLEALVGALSVVAACEEEGHLTFRAELITDKGFSIVRIRGESVEEVNDIFC